MTDLADLPWYPPEPDDRASVNEPRKCRHPGSRRVFVVTDATTTPISGNTVCGSCNATIDPAASRRGRNNRKRGNRIELDIARRLGIERVGQYGTEVDAKGDWLIAQVKSGGYFPERIWKWLNAMSATAAQTRAVVLTDAPGAGHRRRALVVVTLEDWEALHAGEPIAT